MNSADHTKKGGELMLRSSSGLLIYRHAATELSISQSGISDFRVKGKVRFENVKNV